MIRKNQTSFTESAQGCLPKRKWIEILKGCGWMFTGIVLLPFWALMILLIPPVLAPIAFLFYAVAGIGMAVFWTLSRIFFVVLWLFGWKFKPVPLPEPPVCRAGCSNTIPLGDIPKTSVASDLGGDLHF